MDADDEKIIEQLTPDYFAVTKSGNSLYCQTPSYPDEPAFKPVGKYIHMYQIAAVGIRDSRLTPWQVMFGKGIVTVDQFEDAKKKGKVPLPKDCPLIRWELVGILNESAALAGQGVAHVVLAAAPTAREILAQRDVYLALTDDSKTPDAGAAPDVPDPTLDVDVPVVTQNQSSATGLLDMNDAARVNAREQLKAMIDGRADGQDPLSEFNPLDLLLKKNEDVDDKST